MNKEEVKTEKKKQDEKVGELNPFKPEVNLNTKKQSH
jgi:hypothetical protein